MGQGEVFDYLCMERLSGNDAFFSSKQVSKALKESSNNIKGVRRSCRKLFEFGFLDLSDDYPKKFRVKKSIALKQKKRLLLKQY